jgi:hypothetical protein
MTRGETMRRITACTALVLGLLLTAAPARASFTENELGCSASAAIVDGDKTYRVDASSSTAKVPRQGTANYEGGVETVTHDHFGDITVKVLAFSVKVGDWGPSDNASAITSYNGVKQIPGVFKLVPPGKYAVSGFHQNADGKRCAGHITLDVQGSPFSSPLGSISVIGTLGSLIGFVWAGRGGRYIGGISGFFLGLFAIGDAILFKLANSDATALLALPVLFVIAGIAFAGWGPFAKVAVEAADV